jgi:hypothetical protein
MADHPPHVPGVAAPHPTKLNDPAKAAKAIKSANTFMIHNFARDAGPANPIS